MEEQGASEEFPLQVYAGKMAAFEIVSMIPDCTTGVLAYPICWLAVVGKVLSMSRSSRAPSKGICEVLNRHVGTARSPRGLRSDQVV